MSISFRDMQGAMMEAQAEALEMVGDILADFSKDLITDALRAKWASMSPEMKEEIKAKSPENYAAIEDYIQNEA